MKIVNVVRSLNDLFILKGLKSDNGKSPICEYKGYFRVIHPPNKGEDND